MRDDSEAVAAVRSVGMRVKHMNLFMGLFIAHNESMKASSRVGTAHPLKG